MAISGLTNVYAHRNNQPNAAMGSYDLTSVRQASEKPQLFKGRARGARRPGFPVSENLGTYVFGAVGRYRSGPLSHQGRPGGRDSKFHDAVLCELVFVRIYEKVGRRMWSITTPWRCSQLRLITLSICNVVGLTLIDPLPDEDTPTWYYNRRWRFHSG